MSVRRILLFLSVMILLGGYCSETSLAAVLTFTTAITITEWPIVTPSLDYISTPNPALIHLSTPNRMPTATPTPGRVAELGVNVHQQSRNGGGKAKGSEVEVGKRATAAHNLSLKQSPVLDVDPTSRRLCFFLEKCNLKNENWPVDNEKIQTQMRQQWRKSNLNKQNKTMVLPVISDRQDLPLSCEASAAGMLAEAFAKKYGVSLPHGYKSWEDYLIKTVPRDENPHHGFRGSITGKQGFDDYGIYAEPVAEALKKVGIPAKVRWNLSYDEVADEIKRGYGVVIWVSYWKSLITREQYDDRYNEEFTLVGGEHTVVVYGVRYAPNTPHGWEFFVADPLSGSYISREFSRWKYFNNSGLAIGPLINVGENATQSVPQHSAALGKMESTGARRRRYDEHHARKWLHCITNPF